MSISNKYKKYNKEINKKNLKKLSENNWFTKFFEIKYLDLFLYYYNDEQLLEEFSKFGKTINLSGKTKSFYYLLQKYKNLKENIIKVIDRNYLVNNNTKDSDSKDDMELKKSEKMNYH